MVCMYSYAALEHVKNYSRAFNQILLNDRDEQVQADVQQAGRAKSAV